MHKFSGTSFSQPIHFAACMIVFGILQVVEFHMAKTEYHNGAPHYNLVSSELWYQNAPSDKPIAEYAKDQGFDMHLRFADQTEAAALEKNHKQKIWLGMAIGIAATIGAIIVFGIFGNSWPAAIGISLLAPLFVATRGSTIF